MEKRLVIFLLCSVLIMSGYVFLKATLAPPVPVAKKGQAKAPAQPGGRPEAGRDKGAQKGKKDKLAGRPGGDKADQGASKAADAGKKPGKARQPKGKPAKKGPAVEKQPAPHKPPKAAGPAVPDQWLTLGSFAPDSPYRLLVTLCNRGASVERVELVERFKGQLHYRDLDRRYGYLGLQCRDTADGCLVKAVGPGTPAALAKPKAGAVSTGIVAGDVVESAGGVKVRDTGELEAFLAETKPGETITLGIRRLQGTAVKRFPATCVLAHRPLELIQPESPAGEDPVLSYLVGLDSVDENRVPIGQAELDSFTSLRNSNWQVVKRIDNEIAFRLLVVSSAESGGEELEFIKTFRLGRVPAEPSGDGAMAAYQLQMTLKVSNHGPQVRTIGYSMEGPNGLPTEGWWFTNKIHPSWGAAGARDVIWRVHGQRHSLRSASQIYKQVSDDPDNPLESVLTDKPSRGDRTLDYLGVDTQYFSAVLVAGKLESPTTFTCAQAYSMPVGEVPELKGRARKTLNTTYRVTSEPLKIEPGKAVTKEFHLFLGPKSPPLLARYGLGDIIEYGWFGWIAKPLSKLLHFFHMILWNYGLAIILLTVLVRGAMFPIGRKAARNAQMMQELAPEIKKIKEKYKNDLEKQAQAQRELWKSRNFNPLGGCWLMFLQLPIFIGLYRCLSVDIELRQAALIPGLHWCSNLAGPDMLWKWESLGPAFLTGKTGWLGPYLNVLPVFTIILFIAQQKLFTPPATDDQTRMQQQMMKYMMVFMGVLFFKVPAGLCLYFIASSIWGIAERKLLPKTDANARQDSPPKKSLLQRLTEKPAPDRAAIARERRKRRK